MIAFGDPSVRIRRQGDAYVIEVHGEMDLAGAPAVRDALAHAVDEGSGPVIVDLGGTALITSAVMATLLNALRRLTRMRRRMVVVGGKDVERMFRLARLDETFKLCPDVETALRRLADDSLAA
jgi:anti-sigma B factor antagonist